MNKNLGIKLALIIGILLIFLFGIFGVPKGFSGQALLESMQERIHLGLDLKGGTHLILQVQVNDAVKVDADNALQRLKEDMKARKIYYTGDITQPDPVNAPDKILIKGVPPESTSDLRSIVSDRLPEFDLTSGAENSYTVSMKPQSLAELKTRAVQQAIETIRNRIDQLGVSEPVIQEHGLGQYQILVQLPGVDDPARVKQIMQSTAMLEIRQSLGGPYSSQEQALQEHGGVLPPDAVLMPGKSIGSSSGEEGGQTWYLISRASAVTGRDLRTADPSRDENGQPAVHFTLTGEGGRRFASFTGSHVGDYLAVVLDNKVQEVAVIKEQIHDTGVINGRFKEQETKDLAMILRSGALPAGIKYLEERTVGPSLGADSIRAGVQAAIIGMLAVLIFMLVYYHGAGINADIALILNLIILLGFLGYFEATLTLPGIAGVILTVGMGVDSNVLIFERIREELRNGKTPPSAVEQGFGHAWITIVDTHVTTIVSAAILFLFGTGPVKGFAVTLTFGLLANLFTAVFVSRVIFDWILSRKQRGEALSIG
jgi:preprotein translocase subunit SecD